jgi:hypothetical protein
VTWDELAHLANGMLPDRILHTPSDCWAAEMRERLADVADLPALRLSPPSDGG